AAFLGKALARDLPDAPNAFPLIEAVIKHIVFADVALGPVASPVAQFVSALDDELADAISPLPGHLPLAKRESQFHHVPAGNKPLQIEARPWTAGKARVRLETVGVRLAHGYSSVRRKVPAFSLLFDSDYAVATEKKNQSYTDPQRHEDSGET